MTSIKDLDKYIDKSKKLEISWSVKRNEIRHTAIVLTFDGVPVYTLDYGSSTGLKLSSLAPSGSAPNQGVDINKFDQSVVQVKGRLVAIPLESANDKEDVKEMLREFLEIGEKPYNLLTNNCRHYVVAVLKCLIESRFGVSDANLNIFAEEMKIIVEQDEEYAGLAALIGGLISMRKS